jgi:hypothetical protein
MEASIIVETTSTNGTPKIATLKSSGDWLIAALIQKGSLSPETAGKHNTKMKG